jgi:tRNA/rRNA methyltransferase
MGDHRAHRMTSLENVSVVLHHPRSPENIGASARAMWNMGVAGLVLVGPLRWDEEAMLRMATREAAHVIRSAEIHESLESALGAFHVVVGTTARSGGLRRPLWTPWRAARRVVELGSQDRVALLFGPEDRGLTNHDIRLCHMLARIPTARFASLNVAQAVMVMCYELHRATLEEEDKAASAPIATVQELERMYSHLQETLIRLSVVPSDHPQTAMLKARQFLSRVGLTHQETQMIRGLCRQIEWYGEMKARDALERGNEKGEEQGEE